MEEYHTDSTRQPDSHSGARVFVSGDGVAGLSTGLALHESGHTVTVYRVPDPRDVPSSGRLDEPAEIGGIVVDRSVRRFLDAYGVEESGSVPPTTTASEYRYLAADGAVEASFGADVEFTAHDTLRALLRNVLPSSCQRPERSVEHGEHLFDPGATDDTIQVTDSAGETSAGDLFVAADGWLSETRQRVHPSVAPTYAGYVSWHGTLDESEIPPELTAQFTDAVTVSRGDNDLLTAVVLPGADGSSQPDDRRVHWVWYTPVADRALGTVLTDRHGDNHDTAVPPGDVQNRFATALRERASKHAPQLTRLVRATTDPGVQPVVDLAAPSAVVGRTALVGDAAFTTRHHTAASTPKALGDAATLAKALDRYDDIDRALADWANTQEVQGRQLVEAGRMTDLDRLVGRV